MGEPAPPLDLQLGHTPTACGIAKPRATTGLLSRLSSCISDRSVRIVDSSGSGDSILTVGNDRLGGCAVTAHRELNSPVKSGHCSPAGTQHEDNKGAY